MKSREEQFVADADWCDGYGTKKISEDLGKLDSYLMRKKQIYNTIGLGALKYYILKVDPKKRIFQSWRVSRFRW
jgi:arginyl-tRNA synthetase